MNQQQMLEYYKESYYHEFDHKDKINSRVSIPAGILPLLAVSDIYLINHIKDIDTFWKLSAMFLVAIYSFTLFGALFYIFRTLYNHNYGYTATSQEIYNYRRSLEASGYSEDVISEEMSDYLSSEFARYASINHQSNLNKIFYLRVVYYWLIAALITGLLCIAPFTLGKKDDADVTKIQVINPSEKEVSQLSNNNQNNNNNQSARPPASNRPQGVIINENFTKDTNNNSNSGKKN